MTRQRRSAVAFVFAACLMAVPAAAQLNPTVVYQNTSVWNTGFQAAVGITNNSGTPINNWILAFEMPNAITSIWNAQVLFHVGNNYIIGGDSWDQNIPARGNVSFGFVASGSGTGGSPTGCLVNGTGVLSTTCPTGRTDHTAPTVPTGLHSPSQTQNSVLLVWNASVDNPGGSGLAGYDVFTTSVYTASTASTSLNVTGLASNTQYSFQVRSRDNAGNVSALSPAIYVSTGNAPPPCNAPPGMPGNFSDSNVTAYSVTLSWTAANPGPNCTITGYQIQQNGTQVATVSGSTLTTVIGNLSPDTNYQFTMTATNQYGTSQPAGPLYVTTASGPPPNEWPASVFAPYADMLLYPTFSLSQTASSIGVDYFTMAFIVDGGGCSASWGGVIPLSQGFELSDVAALRAEGGDVIISFGGADGQELAQVCTTLSALEAQYQAVVNMYSLTRIDFDIEGGAIEDLPSITRRNQALAALQAAAWHQGKQLLVQYTLPVMPWGLTQDGTSLLQNAVSNGVQVSYVNVMAMDYGGSANPYTMGQNAIDAVNSTVTQLQSIFPEKTQAQLYAMMGVTPMIGLNDVSPEVFTLGTDAPLVLQFAQNNSLGLLAMWSITRDQECPGDGHYVGPNCSGVDQTPFAFSLLFKPFTTPPPR